MFPEPLSRFSCGRRYVVGVLASSGAVEARGLIRVDGERAVQGLRLWGAPSSPSPDAARTGQAGHEQQADRSAAGGMTGPSALPTQAAVVVSDMVSSMSRGVTGEVDIFVALGGEAMTMMFGFKASSDPRSGLAYPFSHQLDTLYATELSSDPQC